MRQTLSLEGGRPVECVINVQPHVQALQGIDRLWKPYRNLLRTRAKYMVCVGERIWYSRESGLSMAAHIERKVREKAEGWSDLPAEVDLFISQRRRAYRARIEYGAVISEQMMLSIEDTKEAIVKLGERARVVEGEHRKAICPEDDLAVSLSFDDLGKSKYRSPATLFLTRGWGHPTQASIPLLLVASFFAYALQQDTSEREREEMEEQMKAAQEQMRLTILQSRRNVCPLQWEAVKRLLEKDWAVRGRGLSGLSIQSSGAAVWTGTDWASEGRIEAIRDFADREGGSLSHGVSGWSVSMRENWDGSAVPASPGVDMELWYSRWQLPVEYRGGTLNLSGIERKQGGPQYKLSYSHGSAESHAVTLFDALLQDLPCRLESVDVSYSPNGERTGLQVSMMAFGPAEMLPVAQGAGT